MKIIESYKENIPDYALSYLVNNDASGLDDKEIETIDKYMSEFYDRATELKGFVIFINNLKNKRE